MDALLDGATVRAEFERWARQGNSDPLEADVTRFAGLLTRYLSQPLSDSEAAWAYKHLANVFACSGQPAEAVRVHEAFERWLPGKSPRLSVEPPSYNPAPQDSRVEAMGPADIRLQFLAQSVQFATSYGAVGRYSDYVAKADAALTGLAPTRDNLRLRFFAILIFVDAARLAGDFDRAERGILQANAVAEQTEDARVAELRAFTVLSEIQLARRLEDRARCAQKLQEALSLVEGLEKDPQSTREWRWFRDALVDYFTWSNADYS
jgi:hypothetical protein